MRYEFKASDVYEFATSIGAETRKKGNELFFKFCPYCNGGEHRDKESCSVNLDNGTYKCFRDSCGEHGHFVEMARDFSFDLGLTEQPKTYKRFPQIQIEVRSPAVEYLRSRGISEEIAKRYKITTQKAHDNILVFPFYDENNILTCAKYRKTDFDKRWDKCKEWFEKDTEPILFGMAQCDSEDKSRLVITEGQLDSLSVVECGIKNAVSVPTGSKGFKWLKRCYDWVMGFSEIVVFGDCEKGHVSLAEEMQAYFSGKIVKTVRMADYLGEKDANDILRTYGKDAVIKCIEKAEIQEVKKIKKLSNVKKADLENLEHIKTGIANLDEKIRGFYMGQVIVLTGKRGQGKSTLASQIFANTIEQGYNVLAYSGELPDYHFKHWLDLQIVGSDRLMECKSKFYEGETFFRITDEDEDKINAWYDDKAYIYDNTAVSEDENEADDSKPSLLKTVESAICRYGVKFVLLDNLMTALNVDMNDDLYRAQSKFLKSVKDMAMKYDVVVLLIAHPKKTSKGEELDNDSISGSGDITNRVDVVLTYGENNGADKEEYASKIAVTKNRLTGITADGLKVIYGSKCKRIGCNAAEMTRVYSCFADSVPSQQEEPPF